MEKKDVKTTATPVKESAAKTVAAAKETVAEAKVAVEKKATEVKKTAEKKATEVKKTAEKKASAAKKTAEKKTSAAKATAKKTVAKAAAKTVAPKFSVALQYQNNEVSLAKVEENVKAQFVAEGHAASSIKKVEVYVKPEDYSAYYVINDKFSGRVDLF